MERLTRFTVELAVLFVVFAVAGAAVGVVLAYRSNAEDLAMPSRLVTVVGVWDGEGGEICRAFSYRDLLPSLDTLRIRFDLSAADIERCQETFSAYDASGRWPRQLRDNEGGYPSYSFDVEDTSPLTVMVHRGTDDPADWAETRYRVDADGTISHVTTDSASAGQGLGPVFGAFLGIVAWFFVAALQLLRLLAGRGRSGD